MNTVNVEEESFYVLRDTETNEIKPGAKNQFLFNSPEQIKRSIPHTYWWTHHCQREGIKVMGLEHLFDNKDEAKDNYHKVYKVTGIPDGPHLDNMHRAQDAYKDALSNLRINQPDLYKQSRKVTHNTKLKTSPRFVIEKVLTLTTGSV